MKPHEQKVGESEARNLAWRALSPEQQLADLDRRLGEGHGATKQRAQLAKRIEESSRSAAPNTVGRGVPGRKKEAA
jgi:hypothetical protein